MPSGPRRERPDTDRPVFFLDRALGRHTVAAARRAKGHEALAMADVYPGGQDQSIGDPEWIRRVAQENWVAISKDRALLRDHADTITETTIRLFVITNANLTGEDTVERLMANWEAILRQVARSGPYVYAVLPDRLEKRWP